ncbi:hypothetical protein MPER_05977 [Moniliophthora perniciosa FA553]|nr:hypothetical protein MPER_05977 [Moniliophthora perniciosa FA553]
MLIFLQTQATASTLSLLRSKSQGSDIPYLQDLASWAYDTYQEVLEHNETPSSLHYLLATEVCEKVHRTLLKLRPEEMPIRTRMQGEVVSARLRASTDAFPRCG